MTIALGLMGSHCLVMGADTQETWGGQKYQQGKIMSAWRAAPNPGAICVSGAGAGDHIDAAAQEIVKAFLKFSGTMDEYELSLKGFVENFYKRHVFPFVSRGVPDAPEFQLIIGVRHAHESRLWTTAETVMPSKMPYAVVGVSRGASIALLGQFYQPFPSLNVTAMLAAYIIRQAKLGADGVGLATEIRFIIGEMGGIVPEETIEAWDEIFGNYHWLQREMFAYIAGFSPIVPRLPGVVVPRSMEFRNLIRELKKMRKQLAALPAMTGLIEEVMPSTSGKSEPGP